MTKRQELLLNSLQDKTDDEKREILAREYNLNWDCPEGPCKLWFAKVFTYCNTDEFEDELDFFFFLVNIFGYLWHICFNHEDTVFLGCTCPCGNKQTILYYSITFGD
ncbi:hypothetical protein [Anaerotignum sp. MB30-C6]|uniref:hypothetical protein n=1 Tax=Anaerotignum sp. MB30-C6 TaxID=3070814 RepID=UPI0027DD072E|nr:hypothetical protein [Anaerotignum sp. MB30-C6]WMI81831.1 hypothetical protein RBQ60_03640 [Anaerotignum sp. MB30-C6]WMI81932.1 hypothetical protein RBQ60_04160 [Anaerotignum sp. MB30-C6]